jgi:23S rRNA pseudouridine1911/1915/1917 synthase
MRKAVYIIAPETKAGRLDTFISQKSHLTRSFIQKLIRQGLITVNLNVEKAGYKLKKGDKIELIIPDEPERQLVPEDIPLEILWEDEHIVVVNKPPDMVIYPAVGNRSGTLMNALVSRCRRLSSVGAPLRPGVVHRLDKNTSGVIVVAKDDKSHHGLVNQFKNREVEKHYTALLYGRLKEDSGEIKSAIGRSLSDRKKMSVKTRNGKEAITKFEVVRRFNAATLVNVRIVTGRTHQIRVHFASIGYPVLGDKTYGKKTSVTLGQRTVNFSRQMLHSYSMRLKHPVNGESLEFTAPMPEDMEEAIGELSVK